MPCIWTLSSSLHKKVLFSILLWVLTGPASACRVEGGEERLAAEEFHEARLRPGGIGLAIEGGRLGCT